MMYPFACNLFLQDPGGAAGYVMIAGYTIWNENFQSDSGTMWLTHYDPPSVIGGTESPINVLKYIDGIYSDGNRGPFSIFMRLTGGNDIEIAKFDAGRQPYGGGPYYTYKVIQQNGTWSAWSPYQQPAAATTDGAWQPQAFYTYVDLPAQSIDITLKNASTIQPLTYSLNDGAAVNLNQNTQSGSVTINGDEIITINPILTTRPVTLNGTNIQGVTYGGTTHTQFPTTISIDVTTTPTLTVNGKPAPEITVDYTNTTEPVIT